jgi:hypothetical protein
MYTFPSGPVAAPLSKREPNDPVFGTVDTHVCPFATAQSAIAQNATFVDNLVCFFTGAALLPTQARWKVWLIRFI